MSPCFTRTRSTPTAERVADLFALDDADFVIVPKLGGYPTRKISFSEDQQLCGLVADIEDLAEIATDILLERAETEDLPEAVEEHARTLKWSRNHCTGGGRTCEHVIEVEEVPEAPPAPVEPEATAHEVAAGMNRLPLPPGFRPVTAER